MIDRGHEVSLTRQAEALGIRRGAVYLDFPFAGARTLRRLLRTAFPGGGRRRIGTGCRALSIINAAIFVGGVCSPARVGAQLVRGITYSMQTTSTSSGSGPLATALAAQVENWSGAVSIVAGRGRIDVVESKAGGALAVGDFILFDGSDAIVVHPVSKTFSQLAGIGSSLTKLNDRAGVDVSIKNAVATVDSSRSSEDSGGQPAQHYRLHLSFDFLIDYSRMGSPFDRVQPTAMSIDQITEYWYGPPLEASFLSWIGRASALPRLGSQAANQQLMDAVASAATRLPHGNILLRMGTTTRISSETGISGSISHQYEMRDPVAANIDGKKLLLPIDYSERRNSLSNLRDTVGANDRLSKWRKLPEKP